MKVFLKGLGISLLAALGACSNSGQEPVEQEPAAAVEQGPEPFVGTIPVELVRYFAGGGDFLDTLPADFPPFTLPASFQVLGSQITDRGEQVILATPLAPERARDALAEAFRAEGGWEDMEEIPVRWPEVFLPAGPETVPAEAGVPALELCHEQQGVLRIQADYLGEVVSLNRSAVDGTVPGSWCEQQEARRYRPPVVQRRYEAWQPSLRLPEGEMARRSGDREADELLTEVQLGVEGMTPRDLARHFARQMEAQGWEREADWSGELSAGNAWTLEPAGESPLSSYLNILQTSEDAFDIRFGLRIGRP